MARILYVDCFAGIAGDMMLGALAHLGQGPRAAIEAAVAALPIEGLGLELRTESRSGIAASRAVVLCGADEQPERSFRDIRALLEAAALGEGVRARALAIFGALAEAEGRVHGVPADDVHFHEIGAVDSIVDVVGVAAALEAIGAEVHASRVPLGRGFVRCRHGTLPLPAPATLALLEGVPVEGTELEAELVTPTGAAILRTQAKSFGPLPAMRPIATGWGAGSRDHPDRPGLLRLVLGEARDAGSQGACVVIQANVDDMTAELAAHAMEQALAGGALDAWVTPITMKKGRPAMTVSVLARRADLEVLATLLMRETTTIGLRFHEVGRMELPRRMVVVATRWGEVPVKVSGEGGGGPRTVAPEYEACRAVALAARVPLKEVLAAATAEALRSLEP